MLKKVYVEITNVCNLRCAFCHGTARAPGAMPPAAFQAIAEKLRPYTPYIYLHVLGEPLCHPQLAQILDICTALGFKVTLVTNGTLINRWAAVLPQKPCLYKMGWSLHAYEANGGLRLPLADYLAPIFRFAEQSAAAGVLNVFKLWNAGGQNAMNGEILEQIERRFGALIPTRGGYRAAERVYVDLAERFFWPDEKAERTDPRFCMALRDHFAVLCDGTAVPCCLDADGALPLGNLLTDSVEDVLRAPRALEIKNGFSAGRAAQELCRRCDYAKRHFG